MKTIRPLTRLYTLSPSTDEYLTSLHIPNPVHSYVDAKYKKKATHFIYLRACLLSVPCLTRFAQTLLLRPDLAQTDETPVA
ncbi:hypothetical protein BC629DRAFT_1598037 [Irpex lacteus]|nr:hypothetical protein BC629DRAFT_1598037 [Irpex lacteus]